MEKNQNGIALIETALLLPFLILCSLVVFDIGRLFYSYLILSEMAREAAINGARIPKLSANLNADDFVEHHLEQATVLPMGGHEIIRNRIKLARYLLKDSLPIPLSDISSRSQNLHLSQLDLDIDGDGVPEQTGNAIRVEVDGVYRSMFYPGLPIFTIRAEEVVQYLGEE